VKAAHPHLVPFTLALAYFGCYVPYSAITKALTSSGIRDGVTATGLSLLPIMTLASMLSMLVTLSALGWWRYARPPGQRWPRPNRWTFLSGIATATIVVTTTLAYTFEGVSLLFVMLVMRGGVLVLAPIVDLMASRAIRWFSWVALGLSLVSLASTFATRPGVVPLLCALDLALYLAAYFVRLRLMARLGKSEDRDTRRRYFVEEQMVATPAAVALLAVLAMVGPAAFVAPLRAGFLELWTDSTGAWVVLAGVCSQGTGVFGGLLLLDASETTYCVPLNRAASILGGLGAAAGLALLFDQPAPSSWELLGAGLLVAAIAVLWIGPSRSRGGPIDR
jgi:drug/metabolite transporter (DMT)-like permease